MKPLEKARNATGIPFKILLLPILLSLAAVPAYSEYEDLQQAGSDIVPARIRFLEGSATLQRQQEQDQLEATINSPVYPGDQLLTGDGRAEVELPEGSVLWLDRGSRLEFLGIGDPDAQVQDNTVLRLHSGMIEMDYRGTTSGDDPRIDTPEASVYLMGRGRFRVESDRGVTVLVSLRGVAELAGDTGSMLVRSGQRSEVERDSIPGDPSAVNTLRLDAFDLWCEERQASYLSDDEGDDRQYVQAVPVPVRHYVTELDNYGDWQWMVNYGWVWRPTIYQVGWRPYYNGYWTWAPGGWTWVAYEPWGWVPYHYGRWSWVISAGWVWIPGGIYSGAWVSWAVTPTYVGWCPLDFYNRPVYVHMNVTNVTVNHYGGGWNFLPLNRFSDRGAARIVVRADRVPNLQGAITTRALPRFSPAQVRARPDAARQILRDSSRGQYQLEPPERRSREGAVSFRQADPREVRVQREAVRERRTPGTRPGLSGSTPPRNEREARPAPRTPSQGRSSGGIQDPHALPGTGGEGTGGVNRGAGSRLPRERSRLAPVERKSSGSETRKDSRKQPDQPSPRPRREAAPQDSRDASRRVLDRIFGGSEGTSSPPRQGTSGRNERAKPEKGTATRQEVKAPADRSPKPRVEAPRSQPPRQQPPPPRKEEKKKDKP